MKVKVQATCQSCGARMPRWVGRCPECQEWGSVVEEPTERHVRTTRDVNVEPLASHDNGSSVHIPTGIDEVDRVLGGGVVRGSIVLLAGEPGVGKSTLALQAALNLGVEQGVLIVCGEEAAAQVRARAGRIGAIPQAVGTLQDPDLNAVLTALETTDPALLVVDSIQTVFDPEIPSAPGSVTQVRECGARLARAARDRGVTVLLVGHVTKEGAVAGPRVLEHLVDVVLQFEGDRSGGVRILRALKNRFGSTQEVGFFEMGGAGLVAIRDASAYLLADRCGNQPGSILAACLDGARAFACEIQALVGERGTQVPRRTGIGVDAARLPQLLAVLHRDTDLPLHERDVYVSAVGGIRAAEPACDLAAALAILSSFHNISIPEDVIAFGEIGLAGDVRQVVGADRRLAEARSVGCRYAFVPHGCTHDVKGVEAIRVRRVRDALEQVRKRW